MKKITITVENQDHADAINENLADLEKEGLFDFAFNLKIEDVKEDVEEDDEEDSLTEDETERLKDRLHKIEVEQLEAWGLHRLTGGFVKAEYDECDKEKIYIVLTDGIQSDCCNRTNVTHCSLWRDSLEWTD